MQPRQGVAGQAVVKLHIFAPTGDAVAIAADIAQLAFVDVLRLVAAVTFHRHFGFDVVAVAIAAFGFGMSAFKREMRLLAVVKFRIFPLFNIVAVFTFRAEFLAVDILNGVAVIAGH